jgi:hypothetical protein
MTRILFTALFLAALLVVSTWWLWRRITAPLAPPLATPTAAPPAPTSTPTALQAPGGYRLAGTALGDAEAFAVIEGPTGRTGLYHLNADVPGLGRLVGITADRAVLETTEGRFELRLAPASTPAAGSRISPTSVPFTPKPPPAADDTDPESSFSNAPDQPAF